jgi:hypothetical protein
MKILLTLSIIILIQIRVYSQNLDLVVTANGDSIACKIDSVAKSIIYFQIKTYGRKWIQSSSALELIKEFKYDCIVEMDYTYNPNASIITGKAKKNIKYLRNKYPIKDYSYQNTDKYSPALAGVLGLVPGVGHMYAGEPLRGLLFLGGMSASFVAFVGGYALAWSGDSFISYPLFFGGAIGFVIIYAVNIIDAVQVAKIKNLIIRDKNISINLIPKIEIKNQYNPINTFSLSVSFTF